MSIKFKSSIESEGKIIQSKHRAIKHTDTVQTLEVKVVTKTAAHPYHGSDSNFGYTIDGVEGAYLELTPGITYRFDQSDASNGGTGTGGHPHPLRFATAKDAAGSTGYTGSPQEVTVVGTPGSSGAYTQIAPTTSTPTILHYYCSAHNGMGSYAKFGTQSATDLTGFDTDDLAESSTNKYLTQTNLGQRSIGDLSDVNLTGVANNKILKYDSSTSKFIIADDGGSSSSAITIQEEGNSLSTAATTLNFVGSSVTASGSGATKTITISGTGGSSGQVTVQKNVSGTSPTEATDGSRTDFTISSTPASKNNLQIYIDGVYQAKTAFEINGALVELDAAPASGAIVEIIHFTVIDANIFLESHTATSGQTTFNAGGLIATKNDTQVYIDGVYQNKGNYTVSGSNVVLNPAPATGAVVEIVNIKASAASSGSITWDTTGIKTANFVAAAGKGYFVNTTSGAVTVTLPAGSAGDEIHFTDYASTFDTNKIAFAASSSPSQQKIQGRTTNAKNTTEDAVIRLIYQDDTKGWTADNIANDPPAADVYYLVVAGGGGGGFAGNGSGGGGGAGGYRTNFGGTALTLNPLTNINVTVGTGGSGGTGYGLTGPGADGTNSSYGSTVSATGGGGGGYDATHVSKTGGSGGGGGGKGTGAAGNAGEGNDGGDGYNPGSAHWTAGGGGGSYAAGTDGASGSPGNGGAGTTNGITGASLAYAAGGGGGSWNSGTSNGAGGSSIGGNGGKGAGSNGSNGSAYTGSGGGGGGQDGGGGGTGGNGADGVVILRYQGTLTLQSGHTLVTSHINATISGSSEVYTRFTGGSGNIQIN